MEGKEGEKTRRHVQRFIQKLPFCLAHERQSDKRIHGFFVLCRMKVTQKIKSEQLQTVMQAQQVMAHNDAAGCSWFQLSVTLRSLFVSVVLCTAMHLYTCRQERGHRKEAGPWQTVKIKHPLTSVLEVIQNFHTVHLWDSFKVKEGLIFTPYTCA